MEMLLASTNNNSWMWTFVWAMLAWGVPPVVLPMMAADRGQNWRVVLVLSAFFSWLGGLLALFLLPVDEEKREARMGKKDCVKQPSNARELTPERRRELEKLVGGPKR